MKTATTLLSIVAGVALAGAALAQKPAKATRMGNPLLEKWTGAHGGVPPWDKVKVEDFGPAMEQGIAEQRAEIARIAGNKAAPTFDNTILAMEPQALVEKIKKSETFNQGFATVEYLAAAIVDMELHTRPDGIADADAFERETLARLGMPKQIVMRHRLPQFNHLFSSESYSAGYHSYMWSEVMGADAWGAFEESGDPFDPATAAKMERYILSNGNSSDRAEAFRRFRGRDPDVKALLEVRGFPTE